MLRIKEELAGDRIRFHCVESKWDLEEVQDFVSEHDGKALGIDTESTGINCYRPQWKLRTIQIGNKFDSYVIPARYKKFIAWIMQSDIKWIGHNGPHDIRCIDKHLGYETRVHCAGETYIASHYYDSRNRMEGGTGHELKELAIALVDNTAGRWEVELKKVFKSIEIPILGEAYKSGPKKGLQKIRKAKLSEGWGLIDPMHPAYIAYAAADPILTYRVWAKLQPIIKEFHKLYQFDHKVQQACDRLQRRAIRLDIPYTSRLSRAYTRRSDVLKASAAEYGCANIHSGQQVAATLEQLGVQLTERTPTGQYKTDDSVLRQLLSISNTPQVIKFVTCVLVAKQLIKRRESYTEAFLEEIDYEERVHPSIKSIGARTTRMSVSNPPLQQLPTKDREGDEIDRSN